jgi:hypothetical protein
MSRFVGAEYKVPVLFWGEEWAQAEYGEDESLSTFITCRITEYEEPVSKLVKKRKKHYPEYWFYQEVHAGVLQAEKLRMTSGLSFNCISFVFFPVDSLSLLKFWCKCLWNEPLGKFFVYLLSLLRERHRVGPEWLGRRRHGTSPPSPCGPCWK